MYEIRQAGAKGLGVFAKRSIPRGTRIFSERPLLALRQNQDASHILRISKLLSPKDLAEFLKLSPTISKELSFIRWTHTIWYTVKQTAFDIRSRLGWSMPTPRSLQEHQTIISIFRNNAFDFGSLSKIRQGVFQRIARINHSCVPNAQGNFNHLLGLFNVHTTREVKAGEELTINYLSEHGAPRASRQERLESGYNFICECPACDLSISHSREGEARRIELQKSLAIYGKGVASSGAENLATELAMTMALIHLWEQDGIAGRELASMYHAAAKIHQKLGNGEEASICSQKGKATDQDLFGLDHTPS